MFWSKTASVCRIRPPLPPKLVGYMLEQQLLEDTGGLRYRLKGK